MFKVSDGVTEGSACVPVPRRELASLTIDGVAVSGTDGVYTATVGADGAQATVHASAVYGEAEVTIAPADADAEADGHQVALQPGANAITVSVLAGNLGVIHPVTVTRSSATGSRSSTAGAWRHRVWASRVRAKVRRYASGRASSSVRRASGRWRASSGTARGACGRATATGRAILSTSRWRRAGARPPATTRPSTRSCCPCGYAGRLERRMGGVWVGSSMPSRMRPVLLPAGAARGRAPQRKEPDGPNVFRHAIPTDGNVPMGGCARG